MQNMKNFYDTVIQSTAISESRISKAFRQGTSKEIKNMLYFKNLYLLTETNHKQFQLADPTLDGWGPWR